MQNMQELLTYAEPGDSRVRRTLIRTIERLFGQRTLVRHYLRARSKSVEVGQPQSFFREALLELNIELQPDRPAPPNPKPTGPLMFVANHPFGVADGLALCSLALEYRPNMKIMIHRALFRDPGLQPFMLPVDFSAGRAAAKRNIQIKKEAVDYLRKGGALAVFPGGGISTAQGRALSVQDLEWKLFPAKLIHQARCTVIPVYFEGRNSLLFQLVSQLSETLRLSLVIRELLRRRNRPIRFIVGHPLPYAQLETFQNRRDLTEHLRRQVYALSLPSRWSDAT